MEDLVVSDYSDKEELPAHVIVQVRRFLKDYKALDHKQVIVEDMLGPREAIIIIADALELYRKLRRRELSGL